MKIVYWTTTILFTLFMTFGGVMDLIQPPAMMEGVHKLGYPPYLCDILGFWKLLGVFALLVPGFLLVKEWAYAGFFFNLTGASFSHYMVDDPLPNTVIPLVALAVLIISWKTRPASRRIWKCHSECGVPVENALTN